MLPKPRFNDMTDAQIEAADTSGWIAVLPLGATEQHGPHLPVETDTMIAEGIVERAIEALPEGLPATFLPAESIGYSIEHVDLPGTRTLTFDAAVNRWIGIGRKLCEAGIRKFVMLNAHGGNSPLMTIVATELRVRHAMLAVATSWTRFGQPEAVIAADEKAYGIHGGEIETAAMLALKPDLVNMEKAGDFSSFQQVLVGRATHLRAYGPHAFGWKMSDLNQLGVTGNAGRATAETGEKVLRHATEGFLELLHDVHEFDLAHFDDSH